MKAIMELKWVLRWRKRKPPLDRVAGKPSLKGDSEAEMGAWGRGSHTKSQEERPMQKKERTQVLRGSRGLGQTGVEGEETPGPP